MTAIGRIFQHKRDDQPFRIRLVNGREFWVESGGSVEIDIALHGATTSLCLTQSKTEDFAFLPSLSPEFQHLKIWMISAHGPKTGRVDYFVTTMLPVSNPDDDPVSAGNSIHVGRATVARPGTEARLSTFSSRTGRTSQSR
jgi:hypothetical protein